MMALLNALVALAPLIARLLSMFIKTPEQERVDFVVKLRGAMDKAENDKDPVALSKLINADL